VGTTLPLIGRIPAHHWQLAMNTTPISALPEGITMFARPTATEGSAQAEQRGDILRVPITTPRTYSMRHDDGGVLPQQTQTIHLKKSQPVTNLS
jgi:hypothetical protein